MQEKAKRGRLSSLDLLPEEAQLDVMWACDELKARRMPQLRILAELNKRLADRGIGKISKSSLNRKSLWLMTHGGAAIDTRDLMGEMHRRIKEQPDADVDVILDEMAKTIMFDILVNAQLSEDGATMELLLQLATGLRKLAAARKDSDVVREKREKRIAETATEAVEKAGQAKGLTRDTIENIKSQILGIVRPAA
jgi:Protein of unknown function (DUF3486)